MASISWQTNFPMSGDPGTGKIYGRGQYDLGGGRWAMAEMTATRQGSQYTAQAVQDQPLKGDWNAVLNNLTTGTYDVQTALTISLGGSPPTFQTVSTTVATVTLT